MTSATFTTFMQDQLRELAALRFRGMFGGQGLYLGGTFFGILFEERLYFKTGETSRLKYVAAGMSVFQPNEHQTSKHYFEVPAEVLEDRARLLEWAREAAALA